MIQIWSKCAPICVSELTARDSWKSRRRGPVISCQLKPFVPTTAHEDFPSLPNLFRDELAGARCVLVRFNRFARGRRYARCGPSRGAQGRAAI